MCINIYIYVHVYIYIAEWYHHMYLYMYIYIFTYTYSESPPYLLVFSGGFWRHYHYISSIVSFDRGDPNNSTIPSIPKDTAEWPTNPTQFVEYLQWSGSCHPLWVVASANSSFGHTKFPKVVRFQQMLQRGQVSLSHPQMILKHQETINKNMNKNFNRLSFGVIINGSINHHSPKTHFWRFQVP